MITNNINGKTYIGKHQTIDINDNYMGSGKLLKRAQSKHGLENFKKEILFVFDTEKEMNAKEAELVTEEFCLREDTYNICVGGQGGFSYINSNGLSSSWSGKSLSDNHKEKIRISECGKIVSKETKQKISDSQKGKQYFLNKSHTSDTKLRMSLSAKNRKTNSQTGTMWITNGIDNKKIKTIDNIQESWYKGRVIKK